MHQRSCDLCESAAVIHDTITRSGVVKVRHLCRAHGLKVWREALPPIPDPETLKQDPVFQALAAEAGKIMRRRGDDSAK